MEFVAKINSESGEFDFPTSVMKAQYKEVVDFYRKTGTYFKFSLIDDIKPSNQNQHQLYKRILMMCVENTGSDYKEVNAHFMNLCFPKKEFSGLFGKEILVAPRDIESLNMKEFQETLDKCILEANSFFEMNLELYHDERVGTILTNKRNK